MAVCIKAYKEAYQKALGKKEVLEAQHSKALSERERLTLRGQHITAAQVLIQKVAMETQSAIVLKIEAIVNKVLQTVFPDYSFELVYDIKRGKSEAMLKFYKGENEVNLIDGDGGGVADTAAIALRIAVWSLSNTTDTMLLDEPTKMVSQDLAPRVAEVISELSKQLGLQFIFVTHSDPIKERADKVFTIKSKTEGKWLVSKVV